MATRKVSFSIGEFFHLYNRGVEKRTIYLDSNDYRRFIELLFLVNSSRALDFRAVHTEALSVYEIDRDGPLVAIGAYCLMPNHFHILATPLVENGLSTFMSKLGTGYSMYFNKKYERTGALFQGKFKAEHANSDEYLKYLYAYIHLNPVKLIDPQWKERGSKDAAKSFDFAASFAYSSLPDYLGQVRPENAILNPSPFPEYFATAADMKSELFEWLTYSELSPRSI